MKALNWLAENKAKYHFYFPLGIFKGFGKILW